MSQTLNGITPASQPEELTPLADKTSIEEPDYFCTLTDIGSALEAAAHAAGKPVRLISVAVGDGNGEIPTPSREATKLVHEVYRKAIDCISVDIEDPNIAWISMVIPADVGGFWIREIGVYAEPLDGGDPVLFAYGNHAPYYKLKRILGQAITHELSIPLIMSSAADVQLIIADAGYATRIELLHLQSIVESMRHPQQAVWTIDKAIAANGVLDLPNGLKYQPGKNLVDLDWDGLACYPGQQFEEVGVAQESTKLKLLFAAPAGSEFRVLVRGYSPLPQLPQEDFSDAVSSRIAVLEDKVNMVENGAAYADLPE